MRFAHIGDVHFRPLARHDEYRETFQEFFDKLREHDVEAVVICGDIVHEKTLRITPEIIEELTWWFSTMADICPVHVTLGNHDGNLANASRQDTITPILEALDHHHIWLHKQSGVTSVASKKPPYETNSHDFRLCVFSCFDEKGWEQVAPEENYINIALFHGAVEGSETDVGHIMDGDVDVSFFDGYDFAFLGDIHKQQFLTKDNRVAYCGSPIQQDFGESVNRHGFLLWDIKSKDDFTVEHIELENRKPFVTVQWKGTAVKTIKEASKWPNGSRFRIESEKPLKEKDIARINNDLKEKKEANIVVYKCEKADVGTVATKGIKRNLRDAKTIFKLLKAFLDKDTFTQQEWDEVEEIVTDYVATLSSKQSNDRQWTIKRLEFDNLFGYGEGNVIDFESMSGLTGIFGPNRTGKSSLIAAIMFALFGTPDREVGQSKSQFLINSRKTECKTDIWFNVAGEDYHIQRTVNRIKRGNKIGITHKVYFEKLEGGSWVNKGSTKGSETDKEIRKLIGTVEDFQLTAIAAQDDMMRFLKMRSTNRKDIISRFRDLTALDEMHSFASDDLKSTKGALSALSAQDWDKLIHTLNDEKNELEGIIQGAVEAQEELRGQLGGWTAELEKADQRDVVSPTDISNQEAAVQAGEQEIERERNRRDDLEATKAALEEDLADLVEQKEAIPVDAHRALIKQHHEMDKAFSELKLRLTQERKTLEQKQKTVDKLKVVPCGDQFPTCKYIRDAHEEKEKIGDQLDFIEELEDQFGLSEAALEALDIEQAEVELARYDELVLDESKLMRKINSIDLRSIDSSIKILEGALEVEKKKLEELKSCVVDEHEKQRLRELEQNIEEAQAGIDEYDNERKQADRRIGQIEASIDKLNEEQVKYDEVSTRLHIYERLSFAFSKRGIPSQIIRAELPSINAEISNILLGVVDFTVEMEVDEESDKLEIYINYGDSRRPIEVCSGMERAVGSMAIRVAMLNVSTIPKTNVLVLDEAFNALDGKNVDAAARMFDSLKRWFKTVLIVSHDESIKNIADNQMDIEKKGKDAYIYYA